MASLTVEEITHMNRKALQKCAKRCDIPANQKNEAMRSQLIAHFSKQSSSDPKPQSDLRMSIMDELASRIRQRDNAEILQVGKAPPTTAVTPSSSKKNQRGTKRYFDSIHKSSKGMSLEEHQKQKEARRLKLIGGFTPSCAKVAKSSSDASESSRKKQKRQMSSNPPISTSSFGKTVPRLMLFSPGKKTLTRKSRSQRKSTTPKTQSVNASAREIVEAKNVTSEHAPEVSTLPRGELRTPGRKFVRGRRSFSAKKSQDKEKTLQDPNSQSTKVGGSKTRKKIGNTVPVPRVAMLFSPIKLQSTEDPKHPADFTNSGKLLQKTPSRLNTSTQRSDVKSSKPIRTGNTSSRTPLKIFDLQASLARPLSWKRHDGPLRPHMSKDQHESSHVVFGRTFPPDKSTKENSKSQTGAPKLVRPLKSTPSRNKDTKRAYLQDAKQRKTAQIEANRDVIAKSCQ